MRQELADTYAGDAGGNDAELAALGRGAARLGVPRFLLGVAAVQVEHDDRPRASEGRSDAAPHPRLGAEQVGESQRQSEGATEAQHLTAAQARSDVAGHDAVPP